MKKRIFSLFLALTLCLTLLPTSAFAEGGDVSISDGVIGGETGGEGGGVLVPPGGSTGEGGGIYTPPSGPAEGGGGTYIPEEDTRTEIWCVSKPDSIGRSYDGTTDGGTIPIDLTFTDGTNEIKLKEGTGFTAKKTFDSADAGWHTVTVEIALIGEAAVKYKLKAGEEKFEIGGDINKAYPDLTVSLSKTTCTVGEKLLPLLSVSGAPEDAAVTYYYTQYKTIAGDSEYESSGAIPAIDENTAINSLDEEGNNTYYLYAKTAATKNYNEAISNVVELTVNEAVVEAASVTKADGTDGGTYESLPAALNAAQDGDTVKLLANHTTDWDAVYAGDLSTLAVVTKRLTLELNGRTVDYLAVGDVVPDEEGGILESTDGDLTVMSSGGATVGKIIDLDLVKGTLDIRSGQLGDYEGGKLTCNGNSGSVTVCGGTVLGLTVGEGASVTVSGGATHAGSWFNDGTLTITGGTFGNVHFRNNGGTIAISGGTFGTVTNHDTGSTIPPISLLAKGYAFYDRDGGTLKDGSEGAPLTNVKVMPHTHNIADGKCACGYNCVHETVENGVCTVCKQQMKAKASASDGTEKYYLELQEAFEGVADGGTVTMLTTLKDDDTISFCCDAEGKPVEKTVTLMMNGHSLSYEGTPSLNIQSGKLIIGDEATISQPARAAVSAVFVDNDEQSKDRGTLEFKGKANLTGGLLIQNWGKLVGGLKEGTIITSNGTYSVSVERSIDTYDNVLGLLGEGLAFAKYDESAENKAGALVDGSVKQLTEDVIVVAHTHSPKCTQNPDPDALQTYIYICDCGFVCPHDRFTNSICDICHAACTHDEYTSDDKCARCGAPFAVRVECTDSVGITSNKLYMKTTTQDGTDDTLRQVFNEAADGSTITLLANGTLPRGIYASKTLTLDLNGHSLDGYSLNVGGLTATSQVLTGNLTVIDSSGGNGAVGVTVRDGGTLVFDPENDSTTLLQLEVWGGTVELYGGRILRRGLQLHNGIVLGNLLPQKAGLAYYRGDTQLTLEEAASQTCDLVVKLCSHGGKNGFDGTNCPYCNAPAVAETALYNGEGGRLRRRFANLQTALDADRDGGSTLSLLTDVTGDYTIDGTRDTGIDLNGHSIHGTVTVKAATGMDTTTLSNTKNTTTASIDAVVAYRGAKLAGSGYPAVIGTLKLAEGATWANILYEPNRLGYKVLNGDGTHKWYAPAGVPAGSTELNNVIINRLPITSKTLSLKVDGKNLTGSNPKVERGTTVRLCANCNAKDADVAIYVGEIGGDGIPTYSQKKAEYKKIGTMWYYVVDFDADTIGTYSIYFTASKDGYSVSSNPKMLTVTKLNLSKAVITFPNGNESVYQPYNTTTGVPPYVVTYNGSELKAGVDYTVVRGDSRSTVGTATLTIKATDDGDYTGQKTARWTVAAHKATISVGDIIKAYDGTTDLPANASIKLKSADSRYAPSGGPLPLVAGEDYQILNASYDSANASEDEKTVSFTIKLTDRNYTFEDGTTQKDFVLNGADVSQTFKINQATVTPNEITQYVFNDLAKTYEIDLRTLLPELPVGCEYGKIHNRGCDYHFTDSTYLDSSNYIFVSNEGILTLPIVAAHSANVNDQIGTLTVPIVSTNYQPFELTIKVVIGQRIPLDQSGVSVSATDITYGQTLAESTLTATGSMICPRTQAVIPGTFAWKDGTIKPNAGSYDAEWTFTPAEGYEEYAPATGTVTVTVEPAELTGVSVRAPSTYYTGKPQHASTIAFGQSVDGTTVTFTYSDKVDGDYTSDGPTFTDAGTYTVYYKAEAANHKTATGTFTVTIAPLPISLLSVERISKSYDGTANVTLTASRLTFFSMAASRSGIILPDTALTFSDAQFTMKQADGSYPPSPDVGNGKALSFTMTLANDNYVFEGKPEGTKTVSDTFATDDTTRFTITRADAPVPTDGTLTIINGLERTYEVDLAALLSALEIPKSYGDIAYGAPTITVDAGYCDAATAKIENGKLILPILANPVNTEGNVGSVTVIVTTRNYEDITLTVNIFAKNKITPVPDGEVTASAITYGQPLNASTITGKMKDPTTGEKVPGTFAWKDGTIKPNAGSYDAEWTFTPDAPEYATATGKVRVTVNPKSIVGAVVTLEDTFVYDGTEKCPQIISVVLDGVTLTGIGGGTDYGFSCSRTSQVGTYYDGFSLSGLGNYTGEMKFTWSITPREVTPTITVADGTYNGGNPVQPTVTLTDDLGNTIDPKEYDVSYSDNTNAGTATVTVTDKEGGNYVLGTAGTTFTINKAAAPALTAHRVTQKYSLKTEQTITLPDLKSLGMPDDAQVSDTNAFHSGSYSPAGRIQDGWGIDVNTGAITYALADGAAAGDVITFTLLVRSKNYEDATVTVILTLTERDAPILTLPDIITVDYTGAEIPVSAVTGKSAAFDGKDVPGTWSWKAGQAITNATDTGSKTIVFTPADLVNYHPVEGEVYVIISRVAPMYTAPAAIDGLTYSGSAQALVKAGSTAHGKLLYSLSKDGAYSETIPTGTDAGEYTVWYKVEGDSNHKDSQPESVTATIAPKAVTATVTVSGGSLTYTGDPLKPGVIVKDGDTVISPEEYDVSYRDNVNAGTATVTVRNKAGGNYTVSGSATFEIGKAASEVRTAPGANAGLVYNGGEQTLITAGTALGGRLKYRLGETGEFTEALPKATDAGTYTVYCMVEGDGNHRDLEVQSLTVTIDKAKVTVKALDKRIYTDDKAPDLSKPVLDKDYTVSAMFGEDALTGDIKLAYVDANGTAITPDTAKVGKVIIRAGGLTAPNGNYTVVFVDGTLTIDERPVYTIKATAGIHGSITPSGDVDVLHGGSQTFTIAANRGYAISNIKIDGVSIGAVKSYTFENVTGNHTIEVTFMKANGNPQTGVMVDEVTGEYYVG